MTIPRIIHQIWIGPKKAPEFMYLWKDFHPDYEYILWDEEKIKDDLFPMINQHLYDLYETEQKNTWNGRSNIVRLEILNKYGGIYIDADACCLRKLDDFLLNDDFFTAYLNEKMRQDRVANGVIGTIPNHKIIQEYIQKLNKKKVLEQPSFKFSGPVFFTDVIKETGLDVQIYPSYYFFPNFFKEEGNYKGNFKPYSDHVWGTTKNLYGKI